MSKYQRALVFASIWHNGQKRRGGADYIVHPIRVADALWTEEQKVAALLHDVVEDTDCSLADIYEYFGAETTKTINALTHRKGESYVDYIYRVLKDRVARQVKIADIADNLSDQPSENAIEKSAIGLTILTEYGADFD